MIHFRILFIVFILACCNHAFGQSDSIPGDVPKDSISAFFIIDKIWTDKNSAYKRPAIGSVNFLQIINGKIYIAAKSSKNKIAYQGSVDSMSVFQNETENYLKFYSIQDNNKTGYRFYTLELRQDQDFEIFIRFYSRPTLNGYFFSGHPATDPEINEIKKYFADNMPKY